MDCICLVLTCDHIENGEVSDSAGWFVLETSALNMIFLSVGY